LALRVSALPEVTLAPQKALVSSVAWALEASVLIEIASHEAKFALKAVGLVPLSCFARSYCSAAKGTGNDNRCFSLWAESLALDSALTSLEAWDLALDSALTSQEAWDLAL